MKAFTRVTSTVAPLRGDNVDTDQIIPARFLTTTEKAGLGKHLFADWRRTDAGELDLDFVLNRPAFSDARILLAGHNFGCGSSREHAVWSLLDHGFDVILSTGFADIFRGNALRNGLLAIALAPEVHRDLLERATEEKPLQATVDLEDLQLRYHEVEVPFTIDPFARTCILRGVDALGYLLQKLPSIEAYEASSGEAARAPRSVR